jgi:hypothetical protein
MPVRVEERARVRSVQAAAAPVAASLEEQHALARARDLPRYGGSAGPRAHDDDVEPGPPIVHFLASDLMLPIPFAAWGAILSTRFRAPGYAARGIPAAPAARGPESAAREIGPSRRR